MNARTHTLITIGLFAALVIGAARLSADHHEDGWTTLFNGRTLDGWVQRNGWAWYWVEDGAIVGRTSEGSPNSFLCTEKDYADFELTFEVKVDDELNSGVQVRSRSEPDYRDGRVHGPQVEIESAPGEAGYIYSEGTGRGWLSQDRSVRDAFRNDQWNTYRVLAEGPRIRTWINDIAVADLTDPQSSREGFIGLQVHSIPPDAGPYHVRWRNLRIREIGGE